LKIENSELFKNSYKVIANLPFYLTAPVIRKFLEAEAQPELMVLIIQKEVAQRICAKPPDMSLLAVSVQVYAEPKIISYIPQKSFWPSPKADGAIIKITTNNKQLIINRDLFFKIVKAGFSQPRKQLINNLSKKLKADKMKVESWLWKNNIQPTQRAETLTIGNWLNLAKSFN
jgi:16S rRNA (adenine1518-N6/adenine1519-N6)-dimethyltransferase